MICDTDLDTSAFEGGGGGFVLRMQSEINTILSELEDLQLEIGSCPAPVTRETSRKTIEFKLRTIDEFFEQELQTQKVAVDEDRRKPQTDGGQRKLKPVHVAGQSPPIHRSQPISPRQEKILDSSQIPAVSSRATSSVKTPKTAVGSPRRSTPCTMNKWIRIEDLHCPL